MRFPGLQFFAPVRQFLPFIHYRCFLLLRYTTIVLNQTESIYFLQKNIQVLAFKSMFSAHTLEEKQIRGSARTYRISAKRIPSSVRSPPKEKSAITNGMSRLERAVILNSPIPGMLKMYSIRILPEIKEGNIPANNVIRMINAFRNACT